VSEPLTMRMRDLRAALDRPEPDHAKAGPRAPRLSAVASPAPGQAPRIELVAGERIAVASDDSSGPISIDKDLLLKSGVGVVALLALIGAISLLQRLLGL
jgi:hypothetical protein